MRVDLDVWCLACSAYMASVLSTWMTYVSCLKRFTLETWKHQNDVSTADPVAGFNSVLQAQASWFPLMMIEWGVRFLCSATHPTPCTQIAWSFPIGRHQPSGPGSTNQHRNLEDCLLILAVFHAAFYTLHHFPATLKLLCQDQLKKIQELDLNEKFENTAISRHLLTGFGQGIRPIFVGLGCRVSLFIAVVKNRVDGYQALTLLPITIKSVE